MASERLARLRLPGNGGDPGDEPLNEPMDHLARNRGSAPRPVRPEDQAAKAKKTARDKGGPHPRGKTAGQLRNGRVVLWFILGLVVIDGGIRACRSIWRDYEPEEYRERLVGCRRQRADLVVVGGSPVSEGIDTTLLTGISWRGEVIAKAYNLGLPGGTTAEAWHAVKHGVRRPPRLLVYGITASDLNDSRGEPEGPRQLMDAEDLALWVHLRPDAAEWGVRQYLRGRLNHLWGLYRYRNGLRLWAAEQAERLCPGLCSEMAQEAEEGRRWSRALRAPHGYAPRPTIHHRRLDQLKLQDPSGLHMAFLDKYRVGGHLRYLHRLLAWADEHDVAVVLVDMPVSADLEDQNPRAFAAYRQVLADLESSHQVRILRPTRDQLGLGEAMFADRIHLNAEGTARLGLWLRQALTE